MALCINKVSSYILKRKSFPTLIKMPGHFFEPKQSLSDNAINTHLYLTESCINILLALSVKTAKRTRRARSCNL